MRERSRQQSQAKIIAAARRLFVEQGYEAATLRKIAAAAGLGLGTVFHYISDKRDLIYLIFNEEVDALTDEGLAAPQPHHSFREKMRSLVAPHLRMLAAEPELGRILLREIQQESPGQHMERHHRTRARFIRGIELLVEQAQQTGEIISAERSDLIARVIFFTFSAFTRWWLAGRDISAESGQQEYCRLLDVILRGLTPPPLAFSGTAEGAGGRNGREALPRRSAPAAPALNRAAAAASDKQRSDHIFPVPGGEGGRQKRPSAKPQGSVHTSV